jgi:Arc/MetJ-type ribon-helix-helix transcriptional regulator
MTSLIHIRVGKALKNEMQELIDKGLFSNQSEITREGIRHILLKYRKKEGED